MQRSCSNCPVNLYSRWDAVVEEMCCLMKGVYRCRWLRAFQCSRMFVILAGIVRSQNLSSDIERPSGSRYVIESMNLSSDFQQSRQIKYSAIIAEAAGKDPQKVARVEDIKGIEGLMTVLERR